MDLATNAQHIFIALSILVIIQQLKHIEGFQLYPVQGSRCFMNHHSSTITNYSLKTHSPIQLSLHDLDIHRISANGNDEVPVFSAIDNRRSFLKTVSTLLLSNSACWMMIVTQPGVVHATGDSDFAMRAEQFGIDSDESIRKALRQHGTIVLDVRTTEEIATNGRLTGSTTFPSDQLIYIQTDCTPTDCYTLRTSPQDIIPNLTSSTTTIVVHCATGRRANRAKELIVEQGYKGKVLNAGSYNDIKKFFEK